MAAIEVFDRQSGHAVDRARLQDFANRALEAALREQPPEGVTEGPLRELDAIEVTLVDDEVIAGVHERFMDIAGATDVITFDHGEIVISADTAAVQGRERGIETDREIALYVVHGLLHLLGFDDRSPADAARMAACQERLLDEIW